MSSSVHEAISTHDDDRPGGQGISQQHFIEAADMVMVFDIEDCALTKET
jgi:hypothetical protein